MIDILKISRFYILTYMYVDQISRYCLRYFVKYCRKRKKKVVNPHKKPAYVNSYQCGLLINLKKILLWLILEGYFDFIV